LNLKDKNSKFSFNSVKYHHCRKKYLFIHNDIDTFITDAKEVNDTIVNYFENILGGLVQILVLTILLFVRLFLGGYLLLKP
jgi:hypothetical protein